MMSKRIARKSKPAGAKDHPSAKKTSLVRNASKKASPARNALRVETYAINVSSKPEAFQDVRRSLGVTQQEMQRLVGISVRTISDIETGRKSPTRENARRFREIARLRRELAVIIVPEAVDKWLHTPNNYFDGASPLELIERGEADRIWKLIWRIQDGVPLL